MSFDVLAVLAKKKKNENRRWTNREILPSLFLFLGIREELSFYITFILPHMCSDL